MSRQSVTLRISGPSRRAPAAAITLFELLVVLAVAAVLMVIFIYSAQYLVINTRISRVKEEHRILSRALQNYEADYSEYPSTRVGLHALNGPIAYMVRVPNDPFSSGESKGYAYVRFPGTRYPWVLISRGPDGDDDFLNALTIGHTGGALAAGDNTDTLTVPALQMQLLLAVVAYDPTNGLKSKGDIVTAGR